MANYHFDERLGHIEEGDDVLLETGQDTYQVTVDEVRSVYDGEGRLKQVTIEPVNLGQAGQIFTYRRGSSNPQEVHNFQADKVVDYELIDSWNCHFAEEESLEALSKILGWKKADKPIATEDD